MKESVLNFACEDATLVGILAEPDDAPVETGVIIIVGGPQYRVGSHRQFVLLARHLATQGFAALRFDYRGMGDSPGDARDFLAVNADIAAAIDALLASRPALRRVALWGLCDAASAALLYLESTRDSRVAGIALLNPWARSTATLARTHVKHYYWRRLREKTFWLKLLSGGIGTTALSALARNLRLARRGSNKNAHALGFQDRMAIGLHSFGGPVLLVLSGDDYTAREFSLHVETSPAWAGLLNTPQVRRETLAEADHTFSDLRHMASVEAITLSWLKMIRVR